VTAGYRPDDVTDIFVSHLHVHESGGLFDFPTARVHGLKSALEPSAPRLQRLLPEPNRWTVPQEAPRLLYDLRTYPFAFEELELTIVELPGSLDGHAGLLMPYHDGQLFHVGHAVQSLDELTLPLSTTRDAWSILAASKPFTDLETLTKLRRLYHKENLLFVSSGGGRAQLPSVRSSLPELPFLQSPIHG
jgi:glyoxylase-like metal-dependent hydrolase (beta-lactamase superfamily II)